MITAVFTDYEYAYATGLWQWDYGQVLRVQGLLLPPAVEVHFSLQETGGEAVSRIGITRDGVMDVPIPDSMLGREVSQDYYIYAFIYLSGEESGKTTHRVRMKVKARPKPEAPGGDGEATLGDIMEAVLRIAEGKADRLSYEGNILKLFSGETELSSVTITGGSGGGADAREIELKNNGAYIQWRYAGDEAWADLVPLEDITGTDGTPGQDGKTAYEYAKEGGYEGTEEEFARKLAEEHAEKETAVTLFDFTAEEDIVEVSDFDIPSQKYKKIAVVIVAKANADGKTGSAHSHLRLNGVMINMWNIVNSTYQHGIFEIDLYDSFSVCAGTGDRGISSGAIGCSKYITEDLHRGMEIRTLGLRFTSAALGAGSTIKVTGVTV